MKKKGTLMDNRTYDIIKMVSLLAVPLVAFLGALCTIWNVPHAEQITATLTAIDTLLGAIVVILAKEYHKPVEMDTSDLEYIGDDDE